MPHKQAGQVYMRVNQRINKRTAARMRALLHRSPTTLQSRASVEIRLRLLERSNFLWGQLSCLSFMTKLMHTMDIGV